MLSNKYFFILVSLLMFCIVSVHKQYAATATGARFLNLPINSYQQASGLTASGGGTNAINYNPAALAQQDNSSKYYLELATSFVKLNSDIFLTNFSGFSKLSNKGGSLGGYVSYLNYGSIPNYDTLGNVLPNLTAYSFEGAISYAHNIGPNFFIGLNTKIINEKLGSYNAIAFAGDLGVKAKIHIFGSLLWLSLAINNVGTPLKFATQNTTLPSRVHFATTYHIIKGLPSWLSIQIEPHLSYYIFDQYLDFGISGQVTYSIQKILDLFMQTRYGSENQYQYLGFGVGGRYKLPKVAFEVSFSIKPFGGVTPLEYIASGRFIYSFGLEKIPLVIPMDFANSDSEENETLTKPIADEIVVPVE